MYPIIIWAGLNHCSPEHKVCGDKLLSVPISAGWLRVPEGTDLSASSHLLSNQTVPTTGMAASNSCSSSSHVPILLDMIKAEVRESCQTSLSITCRDTGGKERAWAHLTWNPGSLLFAVCMSEHLQWGDQAQALGCVRGSSGLLQALSTHTWLLYNN